MVITIKAEGSDEDRVIEKIEEELKIGNIQNKFATHYDAIEAQLKSNTIGKFVNL